MNLKQSTKLSYAILPNPDPLQINGDAGLTLTVSNAQSSFIHVTSIIFKFPLGINAKDLASDLTGVITTKPDKWTLNQDGGWFTATPNTPDAGKIGKDGLTFTFSGITINDQVGIAPLSITETTQERGNLSTSLPLSKFPEQFYVSDLTAQPDIVPLGNATTLSWTGSTANYELEYDTTKISNLPSTGTYCVSDIEAITTFYLNVTVSGSDPTSPVTLQREKTVTVTSDKPDITVFEYTPSRDTDGVDYNQPITLTWSVLNADKCYIWNETLNTPVGTDPTGRMPSTKGSIQIPSIDRESIDLKLTAYHGGQNVEQLLTIPLNPINFVSFTSSKSKVDLNENFLLSWEVNSAICYLTSTDGQFKNTLVDLSGKLSLKINNPTTTFTLSCNNPLGNLIRSLTIDLNPPEIISFAINYKDGTLEWQATSADCQLESDDGSPPLNVKNTDKIPVNTISCPTSYRLTCNNPIKIIYSPILPIGIELVQQFDVYGSDTIPGYIYFKSSVECAAEAIFEAGSYSECVAYSGYTTSSQSYILGWIDPSSGQPSYPAGGTPIDVYLYYTDKSGKTQTLHKVLLCGQDGPLSRTPPPIPASYKQNNIPSDIGKKLKKSKSMP